MAWKLLAVALVAPLFVWAFLALPFVFGREAMRAARLL